MESKLKALLISNGAPPGGTFLQHCLEDIKQFLGSSTKRILFIHYAKDDGINYTHRARSALHVAGYDVDSISDFETPRDAILHASAILIGGGNTFRLLKKLYDEQIMDSLRRKILQEGVPYIGVSAGALVATPSINTTNDMSLFYCPTLRSLQLVPFMISAHFPDSVSSNQNLQMDFSTDVNDMGARENKIAEFLHYADTPPVLALREGTSLLIDGMHMRILGKKAVKVFERGAAPCEHTYGKQLEPLLSISVLNGPIVPTDLSGPQLINYSENCTVQNNRAT